MKAKIIVSAVMALVSLFGYAKDIKTIVVNPTPKMHCISCETRIKKSLRFEKGIKEISTDVATNTVTIKYDAHKTTVDNILKGFEKIDYKAALLPAKK